MAKEIKEVSVKDIEEDSENWEEKDFEDEEDEKEEGEKEEFSIGDTMLARGKAAESWNGNLEDAISDEDLEEDFDDDDFGDGGFSYEAISGSSSGDLYGVGGSVGGDLYGVGGSVGGNNLYGASGSSSGDLYAAGKGGDSVNMYNTSSDSEGGESNLYDTGVGKKRKMNVSYNIEGPKKKKGSGRRRGKSGLESGVVKRKRRSKGVSMI